MNLLENGSFRVYCTVYEYPQITCCYMIDFWTLPFLFCSVFLFLFFFLKFVLFILYHYFKETGYGLLCMKP